jgi:ribose transport system ATP-binding protein
MSIEFGSNDLLRFENVNKSFLGVQALKDINLQIHTGEVHALVGENGAGKSTLVKILTGVYKKDSGKIIFKGEEINPFNLLDAQKLGISVIFQELNLIPKLSIAANIFIGSESVNQLKFLNNHEMEEKSKEFLSEVSLDLNPETKIEHLDSARKQLVEIAKALSRDSQLIIMDEPTSSLSEKEIVNLFRLINKLKNKGVSILYISHYLDEVFQIADRLSVLRDGKMVDTLNIKDTDIETVVRKMIGTSLSGFYKKDNVPQPEIILSVENLSKNGIYEDISFDVRKGEIFGITGSVGAGKSELVRSIFGILKNDKGKIKIRGEQIFINSPLDAINLGIGMLTEERHKEGLVLGLSVLKNISLSSLGKVQSGTFIINREEVNLAKKFIENLSIKASNIGERVKYLSGGNQQKVVLAKWLARAPDILILDEPSKGIDVGAKSEIYEILSNLAKAGTSILFVSSDVNEIIAMADRFIVMRNGIIVNQFNHGRTTKEEVLKYAIGGV